VAGTTVKGALFTFACGVEKQGSIVGVCVKVLGFFGFERKKRLLWGSFGGVLVVFGGYGLLRVLRMALVTISVESSMCS
jgi:hypothetical protein